ncbi:MAG: flagellar hook-basal body complex protein FliE [Acetomicrobium flavidum]|uniref:flagellar hook-basal body complex protein FliE n=1 Tax=Acetomicrobium flavidum TaxID=49896 RepID=UPI0016B75F4E|nr:flagellar hook-basal body complex protein FliE [Acetomicrobium flavidum]
MSISRIDLMKLNHDYFSDDGGKVQRQDGESFSEYLKQGVFKVNDLQLKAEDQIRHLVTGDVEDISQVVTAVGEAEVALRLFVEVRDKLIDAYQQLARIPV